MLNFLRAAFRISLFELIFFVLFSALKFLLTKFKLVDAIRGPLIWICFGSAFLFLLSVIILGYREKQEDTEGTNDEIQSKIRPRWLGFLASWGMTIPVTLGYCLFLYFLMPTTLSMAIALYAGIIIRNVFEYFSVRNHFA